MRQVLLFFFLTSFLFVKAQGVQVFDKSTSKPLSSVKIYNDDYEFLTNEKGKAMIPLDDKLQDYYFSYVGYKRRKLGVVEIKEKDFKVYLEPIEDLHEVVISNTKWTQKLRSVSKKIVKVSKEEIELSNAQTAADLLQKTGQVFVQKSQLGGGSPIIRGFSTNRLLISVDGVRMNNAIFRSGNLQNIISIDPFILESAEVVLGPSSVVYGSDAIGGTMNFRTLNPKFSQDDKVKVNGKAVYRFSSANSEQTFHADVSLGFKKWAFLSSFSHSDFGNLRQGNNGPDDYLRNNYVRTVDATDITVANPNPNEQVNTGFNQTSYLQKIRFQPNKNWDLNLDLVYNTTSNFDRYDRLLRVDDEGEFRTAEWFYGPQDWLKITNGINLKKKTKIFNNLRLTNTYQFFEESRNERDFGNVIRSNTTEKLDAYNLNIDAEKKEATYAIYYGLEYVYNKVNSTAFDLDISTNERTTSLITRYPNGATWNSLGSYFVVNWEVNDKLALSGGLRYNHVLLDAEFTETELDFPFEEANVNTGAFTGSAGATYKLHETLLLKANFGTAFRAPNIDDIGKITQDSEPGKLVVPNPDLTSEYAYSSELGLAYKKKDYIFSLAAYYTFLDDAITTDDFTLNGESTVLFRGEESEILARQNSVNLFTYGLELSGEIPLMENLKASASYTLTKGEETQSDGDRVPVRHVAPSFGNVHFIYNKSKWKLDAYLDFNGGFSFDELAPSEQSKVDLYASDSNGDPFLPSWYTLNIKGQVALLESLKLNLSLENITDQRYRTYSSGISSPGINFIGSLQYAF